MSHYGVINSIIKILAILCPPEIGSAMLYWTTISSTPSPLSASKDVQLYAITKSEFDYESPRLALSYERVPKSHSLSTPRYFHISLATVTC